MTVTKITKAFVASLVLVLVGACGGGGSDSGGGGGPSADFSGTYFGTQQLRYSGPQIQPASTTFRIGIAVNQAGNIAYTDGVGVWRGQINGNSFEIRADIEPAQRIGGLLCRGPQRFNGRVIGNSIRGEYSARLSCVVPGGNIRNDQTNILFQGEFQANKSSSSTRALSPSEL